MAQADTTVREVPKSEAEVQLSFAPVVKQVTPAVVNVYATKTEQGFESPFAGDPFFSRLFGGDMFQSRPRTSAIAWLGRQSSTRPASSSPIRMW